MSEPNAQGAPAPSGAPPSFEAPAPQYGAPAPPQYGAPVPNYEVLTPPPPAGPWSAAPAWNGGPGATAIQPGFFARLDPRGWRTTIIAAVLMVGVVGGANAVNAAVPLPTTTGPSGQAAVAVRAGDPISVAANVRFFGPDGWSVADQADGQVVLQKGRAAIIVTARPFDGTPADLEQTYRAQSLKTTDPTSDPKQITFGNQIPGLLVVFATQDDQAGPLDGVYVAGVKGGTGVVVTLITAQGDMATYSADADQVLNSMTVGG